jgi:hypothetical protein
MSGEAPNGFIVPHDINDFADSVEAPPPTATAFLNRRVASALAWMIHWIHQNSDFLQVVLNGLMVVIWVIYLQIFLVSYRRQGRASILINLGSGVGRRSRCFVSNLSLEPVYLLDVLVELEMEDGAHEADITERAERSGAQLASPSEATNQGPLKSGEFIDIGSLDDLLARASPQLKGVDQERMTSFAITVVVHTASTPDIVGARRCFRVCRKGGETRIIPMQIAATQIRSWWGRRQLQGKMVRRLAGT